MAKARIQEIAMLVNLSISQWSARKYDKKASAEVEAANAATNAGRFNKLLIAKEALEEINKVSGSARTYHYRVTLAWGDNGDRMLPASLFMDYRDKLSELKGEFRTVVDRFVRDYPALKTDAQKRLGKMYNALDYPPVEDIKSRFAMDTFFTPIPSEHDFRVQLSEGAVKEMQRELADTLTSRQQDTLKELWTRLKERVEHMYERLADEKAVFRDSLIENTRDLVSILPSLNITGDPDLDRMSKEVEKLLVDPGRLRNEKALRTDTADRVADILSRMPKL